MATCWEEWLDKDWSRLGSCQGLWELFVSNPTRLSPASADPGECPCDHLVHYVFGKRRTGPKAPEDAMYFIALVLFDAHAGPDFVSGLSSNEANILLDTLVDLLSDLSPVVRHWAFKTLWRALNVYKDCVAGSADILSEPRWKAAAARSWLEDDSKRKSMRLVARSLSSATSAANVSSPSTTETKDTDPGEDATAAGAINHRDLEARSLEVAFCSFALASLIALTSKTLDASGVGPSAWVAPSDVQAIWEIILDQIQAPTPEYFVSADDHNPIAKAAAEPFGAHITSPYLLPPLLAGIALLHEAAAERAMYYKNLNLLMLQTPRNLDALIATRQWHSFIIFVLTTTSRVPDPPQLSSGATKHRDDVDTAATPTEAEKEVVTFALNLVSCAFAQTLSRKHQSLGKQLYAFANQMMQLVKWDQDARKIVRQVTLSVVRQVQNSGFWRTENEAAWEACFELARFVTAFTFFAPPEQVARRRASTDADDAASIMYADRREARWFGYRARAAAWTLAALDGSSAALWEGLTPPVQETWADIDALHIDSDSNSEDDTGSFSTDSDRDIGLVRISAVPSLVRASPRGPKAISSFHMPRASTPHSLSSSVKASHRSMKRTFSVTSPHVARLERQGSAHSVLQRRNSGFSRKNSSFGTSYALDVDGCLDILASGLQIKYAPSKASKGPALSMDLSLEDPLKQGAFGFRPESLGLEVDADGRPLDLEVIQAMAALFKAMGLHGDASDEETLRDMLFSKKERANFVRASEFCRGFRLLESALVPTGKGRAATKRSDETLRKSSAFIASFCSRDAHHLTKKALAKDIAAGLRRELGIKQAPSSSMVAVEFDTTPSNLRLERFCLDAPELVFVDDAEYPLRLDFKRPVALKSLAAKQQMARASGFAAAVAATAVLILSALVHLPFLGLFAAAAAAALLSPLESRVPAFPNTSFSSHTFIFHNDNHCKAHSGFSTISLALLTELRQRRLRRGPRQEQMQT
ncbi:Hypothetical Protein FCC1311_079472 [Hondaea fermentalgiana]|uniref:Uncharacterized protein n=1 Tax=Hondaea fermentalgiana TaxID=2315210 RepID=A0A2R5GLD7_9STRA|nr:Hypothetical Protein FCC1311_079472 [Hondaea fermentalgiana]|eukprot:GBG31722.1 Hypothetical Protein FCC1311_079472 [Hondaea fermentalgiana]